MAGNVMSLALYLSALKNIYHVVTDCVGSSINKSTDLLTFLKKDFKSLLLLIACSFFKADIQILVSFRSWKFLTRWKHFCRPCSLISISLPLLLFRIVRCSDALYMVNWWDISGNSQLFCHIHLLQRTGKPKRFSCKCVSLNLRSTDWRQWLTSSRWSSFLQSTFFLH